MNLQAERKARGLSQKELAAHTGLSREVIADIERGKTPGAPSTLSRLKSYFAAAPSPEPAASSSRTLSDGQRCDAVREMRELEGLTVAAMAKRMVVTKAQVEAMENGDASLVDRAWEALDALKDETRFDVLGEGLCGWCGKVHLSGRCG